jgi:putative tryptophan/tyrosine transport system substrate-binding protein
VIRDLRLFAFAALIAYLGPLSFPAPVDAQKPAAPRHIGVLLVSWSLESKIAHAFRQGLRDAGYTEGRDVVIEWRTTSGDYTRDYARLPTLAAELVERKPEVIVVAGTAAAQAVKHATSTIPIVVVNVADPVGSGLVTNLAHPGSNVTGFSNMVAELSAKRLQLLKEALPRVRRVAVMWNPDTPFHRKAIDDLNAAARELSMELSVVPARTPGEFGAAFAAARRANAHAVYLLDGPLFRVHRALLVKLATKARLPVIYGAREFPEEGGFMSYGANPADLFRRSAEYVVKIFGGTQPGDLPIEQPTKFELVVNLKTAKALGVTIPESIVLQADEVIR